MKKKATRYLPPKSFNDKVQLAFNTVMSFTKWITLIWIIAWCEVILFTEAATLCGFGDAAALTVINDSTVQIGLIVCGFYFSTKCVENVAKGVEAYLGARNLARTDTAAMPQFNQNEEAPPTNSAYDNDAVG